MLRRCNSSKIAGNKEFYGIETLDPISLDAFLILTASSSWTDTAAKCVCISSVNKRNEFRIVFKVELNRSTRFAISINCYIQY